MKKATLLIILCTISTFAFSQLYEATINFESNSYLIEIDSTQTNNVWQIGTPSKSLMDSAYSVPYAIVTDTINSYPTNNTSSFKIKIISPPNQNCWGVFFMSFRHKYDFEPNKDGGYIEVQYDTIPIWTNIILDTVPELQNSGWNIYSTSDTILGGIPAFTGTSNGWILSSFDLIYQMGVKSYIHDSLTIRFTMKSDSAETLQEGWMIDNISLWLGPCTGGIEQDDSNPNYSKVFPNPIVGSSTLNFTSPFNGISTIDIFDVTGKIIQSFETSANNVQLRKQDYKEGIYFYQVSQGKENICSGRFVILN